MDTLKGQRLLPAMIDEVAATTPDRAFASIPRGTEVREGFVDVSYKQLARAIDRCARWIEEQVGTSIEQETLGYVGPSDLRYTILFVACMKTGHTAFFPSPRNSTEAHVSLLEQAKCRVFLLPGDVPPFFKAVFEQRPTKTLRLPDQAFWLDDGETTAYPMTTTFAEARLKPVVALHTSGTTGIPKLIFIPHGALAVLDAYQSIPGLRGQPTSFDMFRRARTFFPFPMFHSAGLLTFTQINVSYKMVMVMPPPAPLTAELADQVHQHGNVTGSVLPPSILADICKNPAQLANLARLDFVAFGGGPLPRHVGAAITSQTAAYNLIGSTETSSLPTINLDQEDCEYMSYSPFMGGEFRHYSDDLYELVIVRKPELDPFQGVFTVFPGLHEYPMHDLYSKHPSKPDMWMYRGRADDVIVFVNGEKLNPLSMEMAIAKHPDVSAALVVGQGKFQSALLVEPKTPKTTEVEKAALVESMWPTVQEANQECPAHGRLAKHLITVIPPEKSLPRASKGTIQRKPAMDLFATEIDALYAAAEQVHESAGWNMANLPSLTLSLHALVSSCLNLKNLDSEADLFSLGLDSLQVINLTRQVNIAAGSSLIEAQTIYSHPSVTRLAAAIWSTYTHVTTATSEQTQLADMVDLLALSTSDLPLYPRLSHLNAPNQMTVLLTGSTGTLGTYLLDALLKTSQVAHIYCLNRSTDAPTRQHALHTARGLTDGFAPSRVTFLHASIAHDDLGLPFATYAGLLAHTTHILHAAWPVDFAQPVVHFTPSVRGVRQLIRFARSSAHRAHLLFVSSVGAALTHASPVPEALLSADALPVPTTGYGQAKLVAEQLLGEAVTWSGTPVIIARLGQIAGPAVVRSMAPEAAWNAVEWFPRLVAASAHMRLLPADLGLLEQVAWTPVDVVAQVLVEMLESRKQPEEEVNGHGAGGSAKGEANRQPAGKDMLSNGVEIAALNGRGENGVGARGNDTSYDGANEAVVYNLLNPRRTTFAALRNVVQTRLEVTVGKVEVVDFAKWVEALRAEGSSALDVAGEGNASEEKTHTNGMTTEVENGTIDEGTALGSSANCFAATRTGITPLETGNGIADGFGSAGKQANGNTKGSMKNLEWQEKTSQGENDVDSAEKTRGEGKEGEILPGSSNDHIHGHIPLSNDFFSGRGDNQSNSHSTPLTDDLFYDQSQRHQRSKSESSETNSHTTTTATTVTSFDAKSSINPALSLLAFWESCVVKGTDRRRFPVFETARAEKASAALAAVPVVGEEWMEAWMKGWGF